MSSSIAFLGLLYSQPSSEFCHLRDIACVNLTTQRLLSFGLLQCLQVEQNNLAPPG